MTLGLALFPFLLLGATLQDTAWVTTADRTHLLTPVVVSAAGREVSRPTVTARGTTAHATLVVDRTRRFQRIEGFGAALTDASALVIARLAPAARDTLLRTLFSPTDGVGFALVRVPLGASDFSVTHDTYDDRDPAITPDAASRGGLSLVRDSLRLPLLRRMQTLQPRLKLIGSPWSAPAWMKSPATLLGGTVRDDRLADFADYLTRVVTAYDSAGAPLDFLTVQNEPAHAPTDYPGMRLTPAQRARLVGAHLGPRLARTAPRVRLLEWDHNWDAPEEPLAVLRDARARRYLHGVAWHCYAGDVSAQSVVRRAYPQMATYFTECSGGAWAPDFGDNLLWNVRTLIIGATTHWARGVVLWNLALDARHGPHLGGCTNCRGVVTVGDDRGLRYNEEYYALAHASRFVRPGAVRVASDLRGTTGVAQVAFVRDDGATVVIFANDGNEAVVVAVRGRTVELPARSVVTVVLRR